ncbi:MAG: ATP-binding protein [Leptothrix ochracea]|uniref:ATP-binding protein n=1 Tax=Leptothrix ochracea TaxID=735331 RepID=UPI0034E1D255
MWNGADTPHSLALQRELDWLDHVLNVRLEQHFQQQSGGLAAAEPPPALPVDSELHRWVSAMGLGREERLLLALALAPHLRPAALDLLFIRNKNLDRGFTEFGGMKAQVHGGFLPTGETAAFLIAGEQLQRRIDLLGLFEPHHPLMQRGLLQLDLPPPGEPRLSGTLRLSQEGLQLLSTGQADRPDYSMQFPAKRIESVLTWDDLVLAPEVLDEVQQICAWMAQGHTLMNDWGLARSLKPGYRALFYGPPGTGKTLTATLIGKATAVDVYRIDLSMVVSKYIGETEKNLARVFDQAETRRWILFFDEADALFGKRGAANNANDHHANQEIAYLLQRVEDFPGIVILASNLRGNLDEAFSRRFQSMIYFPMPDAEQRLRLWQGMLAAQHIAPEVDLAALSQRYELSGGAIANVIRHAAISAVRDGRRQVRLHELRAGLAKELRKEGKTL